MTLPEIQMRMAGALMTPLTRSDRLARRTATGDVMAKEAAAIIKPNDRLTSLERLEVYSRSYWCRLLDSLRDDYPGLLAILGAKRFDRLAVAYLTDCPSPSFTLRDLGAQLEAWLKANPRYATANRTLTLDMARLEWAHIVAFDGPEERTVEPEDLLEITPDLHAGIQPYITLLKFSYPVDVLRVGLKSTSDNSAATSNVAIKNARRVTNRLGPLKRERVFVAVHRFDDSVYYRRLVPEEYRLLEALKAGNTIESAVELALKGARMPASELPAVLQSWFRAWSEFGWLTAKEPSK